MNIPAYVPQILRKQFTSMAAGADSDDQWHMSKTDSKLYAAIMRLATDKRMEGAYANLSDDFKDTQWQLFVRDADWAFRDYDIPRKAFARSKELQGKIAIDAKQLVRDLRELGYTDFRFNPLLPDLLDELVKNANTHKPSPPDIVAVSISSRKRDPNREYLRCFFTLLRSHGIDLSDEVVKASAITCEVMLNNASNPVCIKTARTVATAIGKIQANKST